MNNKLSIVIPSRTEKFLYKTTLDVLEKATGDIEVFPVLDGYEPPAEEIVDDPRVHYVRLPQKKYLQKRHGINVVAAISTGEYLMSLDAHCMMAEGFDEVLKKDLEKDWVAVPRRNRLDAENWCIQEQDGKPPIDYEYTMYPGKHQVPGFHGYKWDERTLARRDLKIDDTMTMQASCWIMHKEWFWKNHFMQIKGFTGWGQEAEEICFTTWMRGGRMITNKNTYYSHLHKGRTYGRMYFMSKYAAHVADYYAYWYFMNNKVPERIYDFDWIIDKFWPIPNWKEDWRDRLNYGHVELHN